MLVARLASANLNQFAIPTKVFTGALIVGVFINSPADSAGIRAGDIIVAVNQQAVINIRDLLDEIVVYQPGENISVTLYRGPEKLTLTMEVTQRPEL